VSQDSAALVVALLVVFCTFVLLIVR